MGETMTRQWDGPPRTWQEVKRLNEALLDAFYSLGLSRYTSGRVEYARTQLKMKANRAAHEKYAQKHYPVWTHKEMMRHLWAARKAYIANRCAENLDALCHVNYNLWHTDFIETYEQADTGKLDLSDPFSGLRKVAESARGALDTWRETRDTNPEAKVGRWVNGANVSVSIDEMIDDSVENLEEAERQLAEALGEPEPLPEPVVVVNHTPARAEAYPQDAAAAWSPDTSRETLIDEAIRTYRGGWTRRERPRLKELRAHAGIGDITRAERNRAWDALKAAE